MSHKFFAKTLFLGKKVYFLPQCHSTNEEASKLLAENNEKEGTVIVSEYQISGKGQRGNVWESQRGKNIITSIILKPSFVIPSSQFNLHTVCSLAIYDSLFPLLGNKLKIKWPNDIYYQDKKICGILVENSIRGNRIENSIIGIGLNVNQIDFKTENATSLKEISMEEVDRFDLLETILLHLEKRYLQLKGNQIEKLKESYLSKLYRFNEQHIFSAYNETFLGTIKGVSEQGKLLVEDETELKAFDFKEIAFLRKS